jgi:predicted ferric reductase
MFAIALGAPLVFTVFDGSGSSATFWSTIAVTTGVQACVVLLVVLVMVARIKLVTEKLGINKTMGIHRALGVAAVVLVALHIAAVVIDNPTNVWLLEPFVAPPRAVAGTIGFVALVTMVLFAERRRVYERWRWAHRIGALIALTAIVLHVWWLNRLVNTVPWLILFITAFIAMITLAFWRWFAPGSRVKFMVADVRQETSNVSTITLSPCGAPLQYQAGQFAWLRLSPYPWSEDHPFTMSSAPSSAQVQFTFRHTGDWTTGLLRRLRPGAPVWVNGPYGAMTPAVAEGAAGIVMVASGVGLTPMLSLLRDLADCNDTRPLALLVPPGEMLFRPELERLGQRLDLAVLRTLRRPITGPSMETALPDRLWMGRAVYYVCGPPSMIMDTVSALATQGVSQEHIHCEQFDLA